MKKYLCLLLAIGCCFCLAACGGNKAPDEAMIRTDLESELSYYNSNLSLKDYEIQQSVLEGKQYEATITATAESTYAEFQYTADVTYTKYDQGWQLDVCNWIDEYYKVTSYPDYDSLCEMFYESAPYANTFLTEPVFDSVEIVGENSRAGIVCSGNASFELYNTAILSGPIYSHWLYSPTEDTFKLVSDDYDSLSCAFTKNIEGSWKSYESGWVTKHYLVISDQKDNSFKLSSTYKDYEGVFTYVYDEELFTTRIGNGSIAANLKFESDDGYYVTIMISHDNSGVMIITLFDGNTGLAVDSATIN